jgi:hypothetical protein
MSLNQNYQVIEIDNRIAALFSIDSSTIFDDLVVTPTQIKKGFRPMIPWGESNDFPDLILEKIRKSDVMSPNMIFNIMTAYGNGFTMTQADGKPVTDKNVLTFFKRNNMVNYLLESFTDSKHFAFSVCLLILSKDGTKIVRIKNKETYHARFEENNKKTGQIENVFFANWIDNPTENDIQAYPVLNHDDPYLDLEVRLGLQDDPETGKKRKKTSQRIFAIVTRLVIPGFKYYPFPYYASHFLSGWYDISALIPGAKLAKMKNGMSIKYHVEFHREYFDTLYKDENISSPKDKKARKLLEFNNIKGFLSGLENAGKVWYSGYYLDPNGKENRMIRINLVDSSKEGGDWIEDSEEASSMACYAMGVHPSLIGAVPGKAGKSLSGSDKRELFTMKQAMEKAYRDLQLIPFDIIQEFNKWPEDIVFDIPHMMLTTLDEHMDAKIVSTQNLEEDDN